MKIVYSVLICFLWFVQPFCAQEYVVHEKEKINRLQSDTLKTGLWKIFNPQRNAEITLAMHEGKIGEVSYFYDGKLLITQNGHTLYFHEADLSATVHYLDGKTQILHSDLTPVDEALARQFTNLAVTQPMFYGGSTAMGDYLQKAVKWSRVKNQHGRVYVAFTVDQHGKVSDAKVISSSKNKALDAEALRVVSRFPRMQPAFSHGTFVRTVYQIPIAF